MSDTWDSAMAPFRWHWQQSFACAVAAPSLPPRLLLDRTQNDGVHCAAAAFLRDLRPSITSCRRASFGWFGRGHIPCTDICSQWFCSSAGAQTPSASEKKLVSIVISIHNVLCLFRLEGLCRRPPFVHFCLMEISRCGAMTARYRSDSLRALCNPNNAYSIGAHNFCTLMHSYLCVCVVNARDLCALRPRQKKTGKFRLCCRATRTTSDGYCLSDQFEAWQLINRPLRRKNSLFNNVWRERRTTTRIWKYPSALTDTIFFSAIGFGYGRMVGRSSFGSCVCVCVLICSRQPSFCANERTPQFKYILLLIQSRLVNQLIIYVHTHALGCVVKWVLLWYPNSCCSKACGKGCVLRHWHIIGETHFRLIGSRSIVFYPPPSLLPHSLRWWSEFTSSLDTICPLHSAHATNNARTNKNGHEAEPFMCVTYNNASKWRAHITHKMLELDTHSPKLALDHLVDFRKLLDLIRFEPDWRWKADTNSVALGSVLQDFACEC